MDKNMELEITRAPVSEELAGYEPPTVITYSGDQLLEEMGPAQACYPFDCPVAP